MVIVFILVGALFGSATAGLVLWFGGSILLALAGYSAVGTVTALLAILALHFLHGSPTGDPGWGKTGPYKGTISA